MCKDYELTSCNCCYYMSLTQVPSQAQHRLRQNSCLACLYECTGRAIAVPAASAVVLVDAALTNCLSWYKYKCDGQDADRQAVLMGTGLVIKEIVFMVSCLLA